MVCCIRYLITIRHRNNLVIFPNQTSNFNIILKYTPFYHRNGIKDFLEQHMRDKIKMQLCKDSGIELISIPYKYNYQDREALYNFIYYKLDTLGVFDII